MPILSDEVFSAARRATVDVHAVIWRLKPPTLFDPHYMLAESDHSVAGPHCVLLVRYRVALHGQLESKMLAS